MMWSDLDTLYDKMLYDEDWVHALMREEPSMCIWESSADSGSWTA